MSFLPFRPGARRRNLSSATRSRVIGAPVAEVWKVIEDPSSMPRWWPDVERMEGVESDRFTQVFKTRRRRTVRADFVVLASEPPGEEFATGHRTWSQEVAGTRLSRCCTNRSPRSSSSRPMRAPRSRSDSVSACAAIRRRARWRCARPRPSAWTRHSKGSSGF